MLPRNGKKFLLYNIQFPPRINFQCFHSNAAIFPRVSRIILLAYKISAISIELKRT